VSNLTDAFLRKLKSSGKDQKISDGGGLYIHVSRTGDKFWRMAYRFDGKQKTLSFGSYPAVGLKAARQRREEAKEQLAAGIDPGAHKKAVKSAIQAETENTFEVVVREWFDKYKDAWIDHHGSKIIAQFEKEIFPLIGGKKFFPVTAPELLTALRRMEGRGAVESAHRTLQECGDVTVSWLISPIPSGILPSDAFNSFIHRRRTARRQLPIRP